MEFAEFTNLQQKIIRTIAANPNIGPMEIKKLAKVQAGADPTSKVRNAMRRPVNEGWITLSAKGGYIVPGQKKKKIDAKEEKPKRRQPTRDQDAAVKEARAARRPKRTPPDEMLPEA